MKEYRLGLLMFVIHFKCILYKNLVQYTSTCTWNPPICKIKNHFKSQSYLPPSSDPMTSSEIKTQKRITKQTIMRLRVRFDLSSKYRFPSIHNFEAPYCSFLGPFSSLIIGNASVCSAEMGADSISVSHGEYFEFIWRKRWYVRWWCRWWLLWP